MHMCGYITYDMYAYVCVLYIYVYVIYDNIFCWLLIVVFITFKWCPLIPTLQEVFNNTSI